MIKVDKAYHMIVGFIIALAVSLLFNPMYGFMAGSGVGLAKELYDQYIYDGFDFFDWFSTIFGAFMGVVAYGAYVDFIGV